MTSAVGKVKRHVILMTMMIGSVLLMSHIVSATNSMALGREWYDNVMMNDGNDHTAKGGQVIRPRVLTSTRSATMTMSMNDNGAEHVTRLTTLAADGITPLHTPSAQFQISAFGRSMTLNLELNTQLFGTNYIETVSGADNVMHGTSSREHCYYVGKVAGDDDSMVAASTCNGLEAAIWTQGERYAVMPAVHGVHSKLPAMYQSGNGDMLENGVHMEEHVVFRKADLVTPLPETCGSQHEEKATLLNAARTQHWSSYGVDVTDTNVARVAARNEVSARVATQPRTVELLLVCDNDLQIAKGGTANCQRYAIQNANIATQLYTKMGKNINMLLVAIHTFEAPEPMGLRTRGDESMETYLTRFTRWAQMNNGRVSPSFGACMPGARNCFDLTHDLAMMLTGLDRSGPIVGLAWIDSICESNSAGVVENNAGFTWQFAAETLTHEMGHSWGAQHDGDGNSCSSSGNIMASSGCGSCAFQRWKDWSSCTMNYVQTTLDRLESRPRSNCLAWSDRIPPPPTPTPTPTPDPTPSSDPAASGATDPITPPSPTPVPPPTPPTPAPPISTVCTQGDCCDVAAGQFRSSRTMCRAALNACDTAEYCTGNSATCPSDETMSDGDTCYDTGLAGQCYHGTCLSYDIQCRATWSNTDGTWLHGGATQNVAGDCNSECGELKCTNIEWQDYCFNYTCRDGYWCTVNGRGVLGPNTIDVCNCLPSNTSTMVADGTPCNYQADGTSNSICYSGQCVSRPPTSTSSGKLTNVINIIIPTPDPTNTSNKQSNTEDSDNAINSAVGNGWQLTLVIIPSCIAVFCLFGLIVKCGARALAAKEWSATKEAAAAADNEANKQQQQREQQSASIAMTTLPPANIAVPPLSPV